MVVCSFCRGQDICDRYRYTVEFSGIGDPPLESQHVSYCSQAAIFTSPSTHKIDVDIDHCNHYSLVSTKTHVWKVMKILIWKIFTKLFLQIMSFKEICSELDCILCKEFWFYMKFWTWWIAGWFFFYSIKGWFLI